MGFENLRVKIEYSNPAKKIIWVQLNIEELPTIKDFSNYLLNRLQINSGDGILYLDDAEILADEKINIIRDKDHLKFVPIDHAKDDIILPINNQTNVVNPSKSQAKNYINQYTQTYDLSLKYCLHISTQTEVHSPCVFQDNQAEDQTNKSVFKDDFVAKKLNKNKKENKKVAYGIGECLKHLKSDLNILKNRDEIDKEPLYMPMELTEQKECLNLCKTNEVEQAKLNLDDQNMIKMLEKNIVDINNFGVKIPIVKKRRMEKRRNKNKMNFDNETPKNNHIIYSDSDKEDTVVKKKLPESTKEKNIGVEIKKTFDSSVTQVLNTPIDLSHEFNQSPTLPDFSSVQNKKNENQHKFKILNKDIKHQKFNYQNKYNSFKQKNIQFNETYMFENYDHELLPNLPIYDLNFETYHSLIEDLKANKTQRPSKFVAPINTNVGLEKNDTKNVETKPQNMTVNCETIQLEISSKRSDERINNSLNHNITINGRETILNDASNNENKHADKAKNISLHNPPKKGDKIVYKILELDTNYNPIVSKYKEASVLEYDRSTNTLSLQNITPFTTAVNGRFSMHASEDDLTNVDYCLDDEVDSSIVQIEWDRLIEPQIVC